MPNNQDSSPLEILQDAIRALEKIATLPKTDPTLKAHLEQTIKQLREKAKGEADEANLNKILLSI